MHTAFVFGNWHVNCPVEVKRYKFHS
jgi:hypothetical protein